MYGCTPAEERVVTGAARVGPARPPALARPAPLRYFAVRVPVMLGWTVQTKP